MRLTVLASLVLVVTKGAVESGQLTQLIALELILALGNGGSLLNLSERAFRIVADENLPSQ